MKTHKIIGGALGGLLVAFLMFVAFTMHTSADVRDRDTRARDDVSGRTTPPAPSQEPEPVSPPPPAFPQEGGISNETDGMADSGGNVGGNVTTGDESVTVIEINIGPTSEGTSQGGDENTPPTDDDQCEGRMRTGCGTDPADGRGR